MKTTWLGKGGTLALLVIAAVFEVAGDALIRKGLRGGGWLLGMLGFVVLGTYGVVVNLVQLDFSKLLGTYVGVFAVASVTAGRVLFGDRTPAGVWIGLAIVLVGSLVIQGAT